MSESGRLATHVEASGLIRAAESAGGHAAVLHKGDSERGALLLVIMAKGQPNGCFERLLDRKGRYSWQPSGPKDHGDSQKFAEFLAKRRGSDPDMWVLELDIPDPERFIAENLPAG